MTSGSKFLSTEDRTPREDGAYVPDRIVRNAWHPNGEFNSISDAEKNESNLDVMIS